MAGHITYRQPDGTFLVNPYGLVWGELQASDIMSMDEDGNLLGGKWTITPAIQVHLELHRARQVTIALHNHPEYGTLWADIGRAPEVYDQTGAFTNAKVAVYSEYEGAVDQVSNARAVVDAMGDAEIALLAHHGVLIVGESIRQLYLARHVLRVAVQAGLSGCRSRRRRADGSGGGVALCRALPWERFLRHVRGHGPAGVAPGPGDPAVTWMHHGRRGPERGGDVFPGANA